MVWWKFTFTTLGDLPSMSLFVLCTCIMGAMPILLNYAISFQSSCYQTFGASPASLHCVLEQGLVLVQPRKTCPDVTERLLTGTLRIKSNKAVRHLKAMKLFVEKLSGAAIWLK